jgi:hypothetical protein
MQGWVGENVEGDAWSPVMASGCASAMTVLSHETGALGQSRDGVLRSSVWRRVWTWSVS